MSPEMQAAADELMATRPELVIEYAGGGCPFQAGGTLHGIPFYFRFRHNWAELRILSDGGSDAGWFKPLYVAGSELEDDPDSDRGFLTPDEFVMLMSRLIPALQRSEILWEFDGIHPEDVGKIKAGDPTTYGTWAHTPEQAWERMHQPSAYLRKKGIDDATQEQWVASRKMIPHTITVDDRVFPDPDPFAKQAS